MRWYEYKMETDDLYAPDDLKAKLLAMTDQLTEEEKAQPMMKTAAPVPAQSAPVQPKKKLIRFPAKRVGVLAACLAVFRDSSMANDSVATNFDQIFETYSPETVRKVL